MSKSLQFVGSSTYISPTTKNQIVRAGNVCLFDDDVAETLKQKVKLDTNKNPIPYWLDVTGDENAKLVYDFTKERADQGFLPRIGNERRFEQSGQPGPINKQPPKPVENPDLRMADLTKTQELQQTGDPAVAVTHGGIKVESPEPNRVPQTTGELSDKTVHQGAKEANDPPITAIHQQAVDAAPETQKESDQSEQGAALIDEAGGPKHDGEVRDIDQERATGQDANLKDVREEDVTGQESQGAEGADEADAAKDTDKTAKKTTTKPATKSVARKSTTQRVSRTK